MDALGAELSRSRAIDILVNNAGTIRVRRPRSTRSIVVGRVIQVDLSSQFALTQAVARGMLARGRGKIIFTASLLTFQGGINGARVRRGEVGRSAASPRRWPTSGHRAA